MESLLLSAAGLKLLVSLLTGLSAILITEVLYVMLRARKRRRAVNYRLKATASMGDRRAALALLRRERGLNAEGRFVLPARWYNLLVLQSGLALGVWRIILLQVAVALFVFSAALLVTGLVVAAVPVGLVIGFVLPVLVLYGLRSARQARFGAQLPEAIDTIVRSLRAGHPVPVAISMVARQMPDPAGSEFGIATDEITYGLDLEQAMYNLAVRVGQKDLPLLTTAVGLQSSTGGNLSEMLGNLADVLRARFRLRRQVRALSAEGRFSAIALSVLPVLLFAVLKLIAPAFYGDIWNDQLTVPVLVAGGVMMIIGDIIMYRMVNFKV